MKLLANDTKIHRGLSNIKKETQELQSDTDQLAAWTEKWSRLFNLDKCEVMKITHKGVQYTQTATIRRRQFANRSTEVDSRLMRLVIPEIW